MTPKTSNMSMQAWLRNNKDIIHDLYHIRALPLYKKDKGDSVQSLLHKEHQILVSRNQLDAYVKTLQQPKKLKKEEWRIVHTRLQELHDRKIKTRVKLFETVLTKEQLQRSKRHAFSGQDPSHPGSSDGHALLRSNSLTIETQGADNEWSIYTGEGTVMSTNSFSSTNELVILEEPAPGTHREDNAAYQSGLGVLSQPGESTSNEHVILGMNFSPSHENHDSCLIHHQHHLLRFGSHSLEEQSPRACSDCNLELGHLQVPEMPSDIWAEPWFFGNNIPQAQYLFQDSPFSQLQAAILATPTRSRHFETHIHQNAGAKGKRAKALVAFKEPSTISHVQLLLQDAAIISKSNSKVAVTQRLPDPDDVLDSLLSLLPETMQRDNSRNTWDIATNNFILDSPFHNVVLYSMMNGFAGLRHIPSGAILRTLSKQHQTSSFIIECLKLCPPAQAKCLADNLFRAAVEACDEETVKFILVATRDLPYQVDPNTVVCKIDGKGRRYTPIEFAAKFRQLGLVKTLLDAGADVNKSYKISAYEDCGALELAIRKGGDFEAVDIALVRTILYCHAEVRIGLVQAAIRWGQAEPLRELISRLPPASHHTFFQDDGNRLDRTQYRGSETLGEIAEFLENDLATDIIKQIFQYCKSEKCMRCSADHQMLMEQALCSAAKRTNFKLVEFLLPHVITKDGWLAAAVRSGSSEMIDLFFSHSANIGGQPCYLDNYSAGNHREGLRFKSPSTPLAEAIRSQDKDLVDKFEKLGAKSHITRHGHFKAAIFAAAEVGDCHYMRILLQLAPTMRGENLTHALTVAIRQDRTEAALLLLDNGADANELLEGSGWIPPLIEALQKQNREVVDAILDADANFNAFFPNRSIIGKAAMEPAVLWGDISIIEDLIFMGADIDGGISFTALVVAVKSGRKDLVNLLLNSGASPNLRSKKGLSPLAAAIENEDVAMIQLLLFRGADPADTGSFLFAIENNRQMFDMLLGAFCSKYPDGKLAFGGSLLITATKRGDIVLLGRMVTAKFDVNSFSSSENDTYWLNPLGFAIMHGKRACESASVVRFLIHHCDPNSIVLRPNKETPRNEDGTLLKPLKTALLVAIETKNEYMVELLLERGANIHQEARRGLKRTPLQQACETGSYKIVKLLLDHGAYVNEKPADWGGATALQLAAIGGSIKISELLLSLGAEIHAAPAKVRGRTALEGAAENGRIEMISMLWNAAAGTGFMPGEFETAKKLAQSQGHRGCAEYVDLLSSASSFPLLETYSFLGLGML